MVFLAAEGKLIINTNLFIKFKYQYLKLCGLIKIKKSQIWSFDAIIGVIIFVGAFFTFYFLLKPQLDKPIDNLSKEAELIAEQLLSESSPLYVIKDGKIDEIRLQELLDEEFSSLKSKIRVKGDFCIHMEDQDGNIIYIGKNKDVTGIGSSEITISGVECQ